MGCFGYLCVKCKLAIRAGEIAVLKHIRHGKVLGEATGKISVYGRIVGDNRYRNYDITNPCNHMEIIKSEYDLPDSEGFRGKIYQGKPMNWMSFRTLKVGEGVLDLSPEMYEEWATLPNFFSSNRSGTEAWHKYCYDRATPEQKEKHVISKGDPYQSIGVPRKKYSYG